MIKLTKLHHDLLFIYYYFSANKKSNIWRKARFLSCCGTCSEFQIMHSLDSALVQHKYGQDFNVASKNI